MSVILVEKKEKIATVTLNRPEAYNAMNYEAWKEITNAWIDLKNDPEIWTIVLTASGDKAFLCRARSKGDGPTQGRGGKGRPSICVSFARGNAHQISGDAQTRDRCDQWFCYWCRAGIGFNL